MASLQAKIIQKTLQLQPFSWAKGSITEQRARQEKLANLFRLSKDVIIERLSINGIPAELFDINNSREGVILYLHGGAYSVGSINVHREYLSRLASACRVKVLAIDYRLAPEHPFPSAMEDAMSAYDWLIDQGFNPSKIVLGGDSAGGGLAIAVLVSLLQGQKPLPSSAVCISPWVDLTFTSKKVNNNNDPILNPEILSVFAQQYAAQTAKNHPLISPIFADLRGLPPVLIHAGTNEILLDQIMEFAERARQADVEVELELWQGLFHVFQIIPILPESKLSLEKIAVFVDKEFTKE